MKNLKFLPSENLKILTAEKEVIETTQRDYYITVFISRDLL